MNKEISVRALVLAAGKGTRMNSPKSKVLQTILGKTIIEYVVEALEKTGVAEIGVVVSPLNKDEISGVLGNRVTCIVQYQQLGTGHAVMSAAAWMKGFAGSLLVLVGDAPFIHPEILTRLISKQQSGDNAVCFLTTIFDEPPPWGRVIRNDQGKIIRIVEEKEASEAEKKIKEVSSSHYCFDWFRLEETLRQIDNRNAQGEYYLPDVIEKMLDRGWAVGTETIRDTLPSFGINTLQDLQFAGQEMRRIMSLK